MQLTLPGKYFATLATPLSPPNYPRMGKSHQSISISDGPVAATAGWAVKKLVMVRWPGAGSLAAAPRARGAGAAGAAVAAAAVLLLLLLAAEAAEPKMPRGAGAGAGAAMGGL